ncbi:hypothetical protein BCR39DRAFT_531931 [Naematelia encephala]|uniref:Uncharacterized protein n=1 Tax=Naematelia encephala TaxID=71784 RepID=A0A1Y2B3W6_9TREE|nr:hypothetical protein BCR39DRAFT_531931 [Naematelia encephala]
MPPGPRQPRAKLSEEQFDDDEGSLGDESIQAEDEGGKGSSSVVSSSPSRFLGSPCTKLRDMKDQRRVEVLSGDKEERVELMTLLIRNLLKENKDLRGMVKLMASFVGEGLGSCLPRLGLSANQLDAILNRADTDTAYEAFLTLKASHEMKEANPGIALGEPRRRANSSVKRKHENVDATPRDGPGGVERMQSATPDLVDAGGFKRPKAAGVEDPSSSSMDAFAYLFPDLDAFASGSTGFTPDNDGSSSQYPLFKPQTSFPMSNFPQQYQNNMASSANQFDFSGFGLTGPPTQALDSNMNGTTFPPPASATGTSQSNLAQLVGVTNHGAPTAIRSTSPTELERQQQLRTAVANLTNFSKGTMDTPMTPSAIEARRKAQDELRLRMDESDVTERKTEALQLITYHLNNFRVNHSYSLPLSLRPTRVQRTIPHEHAIDGFIFPSIRDRMILLRGRYDLVEAFHGMLNEYTIHGQDVLDHNNWEISEKWLQDFRLLADDEVYAITNKWRIQRGDKPLVRPDTKLSPHGAPQAPPPQPTL